MMAKILTAMTLAGLAVVIFIVGTLTPAEAGPFGIMALFVGAYVTLIGGVAFLLFYGAKAGVFLARQLVGRELRLDMSLQRCYYYATVVALMPMMLVGLHAAGGVTIQGLGLVLLFGAIGIFYVAKRT